MQLVIHFSCAQILKKDSKAADVDYTRFVVIAENFLTSLTQSLYMPSSESYFFNEVFKTGLRLSFMYPFCKSIAIMKIK